MQEKKELKFKPGDKVIPLKKTHPTYSGLSCSGNWTRAKERGQEFLYVDKWSDCEQCYVCKEKKEGFGGDFFREDDLVLYRKFKVGDKVVPIAKTSPIYKGLDSSCNWTSAVRKNQGFLYVARWSDSKQCYICSHKVDNCGHGDYFREEDLIPYVVEGKSTLKIEEVEEMSKVEFGRNKSGEEFKVGDVVNIRDDGGTYTTYDSFFRENKVSQLKEKWTRDMLPPTDANSVFLIQFIGRHAHGGAVAFIKEVGKENYYLSSFSYMEKAKVDCKKCDNYDRATETCSSCTGFVDSNRLKELENFRSAKKRFNAIREVLHNLGYAALSSTGSEKLGIPTCDFCIDKQNYIINSCEECAWGKVFGLCNNDPDNMWGTLRKSVLDSLENTDRIIRKIEEEIDKRK